MQLPTTIRSLLRRQRSGYLYFTLIELLVVIGIIAIIAAISIPALLKSRCRAKVSSLLGALNQLRTDIQGAFTPGPATQGQMQTIVKGLDDCVELFKEIKAADCFDKGDKKTINTKIDEMVAILVQNKSSQEEPIQEAIQRVIDKMRGERFPNSETE